MMSYREQTRTDPSRERGGGGRGLRLFAGVLVLAAVHQRATEVSYGRSKAAEDEVELEGLVIPCHQDCY